MLLPGVIAESQSARSSRGVGSAAGSATALGIGHSFAAAAGSAAGTSSVTGISGEGDEMSLISTLTASNSASLAWTGLASATHWRLVGRLLIPASNNTTLQLVVGTGAGPTYLTANYTFARKVEYSSSSGGDDGGTSLGYAPVDDGALTNSSTPGVSFEVEIVTDNANFVHFFGKGYSRNQTQDQLTIFGAKVATSAAITAIKLAMGTGNISSGNASLYSVAT